MGRFIQFTEAKWAERLLERKKIRGKPKPVIVNNKEEALLSCCILSKVAHVYIEKSTRKTIKLCLPDLSYSENLSGTRQARTKWIQSMHEKKSIKHKDEKNDFKVNNEENHLCLKM